MPTGMGIAQMPDIFRARQLVIKARIIFYLGENAHVDLEAEEGENGEHENRQDDDVTKVLHGIHDGAHLRKRNSRLLSLFRF